MMRKCVLIMVQCYVMKIYEVTPVTRKRMKTTLTKFPLQFIETKLNAKVNTYALIHITHRCSYVSMEIANHRNNEYIHLSILLISFSFRSITQKQFKNEYFQKVMTIKKKGHRQFVYLVARYYYQLNRSHS